MFSVLNLSLFAAAFTTALITGLFYAYSCSVNPGLAKLNDAEYIAAMQSINRAIQNPLFFFSFFGTAVLLPLNAYMQYRHGVSVKFWLLLSAALFYMIGTIGITIAGNIPLNEMLDKFDLNNADDAAVKNMRLHFIEKWNRFHTIRAIAAAVSMVCVLLSCIFKEDS
jgi:uncharacterized membrane protein